MWVCHEGLQHDSDACAEQERSAKAIWDGSSQAHAHKGIPSTGACLCSNVTVWGMGRVGERLVQTVYNMCDASHSASSTRRPFFSIWTAKPAAQPASVPLT